MPKMGLVLQGGGALGAYEYGAVTRLVELGWHPVAVTGVSIGAASAAAVAGAPNGDICRSLKRLWEAITLHQVPFWPPERQTTFSAFGNPRFWRMRYDVFSYPDWTSLYDVSPMRETLAEVCDRGHSYKCTDGRSGMFRKLRGQPRFCLLRHTQDFTGIAHTRSHLGKWQSAPWLPDDCDRRRSLLGRRFVRQHSY